MSDADDLFFDELLGCGASLRKSDAERKRESLARHGYNAVKRRVLTKAQARRRARLERNPAAWLRWYFPHIFALPFSDGHLAIINAVLASDKIGKDVVVAAPRGEGKTNILRHMSIYLVFTGRSKFPVVGGWQNRAASEAFNTWTIALTSERLVEDYPEFCAPFADSTHASRLPRLHWDGEAKPTGAAIKSARMQIVFPDGRGAMAAGSLQGDIKGLNITTIGGESLRPDKLLLDDPQDVDRAADPVFVSEVLHKIDTQWLCLAGPNSRISMMVACTIFAPNDVGESLGKRKSSVFIRIPRVTSWPRDFDKPDSASRTLWDRWYDLYCDDKTRRAAFAFYKRNKRTMTDGFTVSWKYRFDASKGDLDALFSAMVDLYSKGREAFFSEYQNTPVSREVKFYELTPQCVQAHACKLPPGVSSGDALFTVLTTDINYSYGFTYEVAEFTARRTCHVLAQGVWCQSPLPVSQSNTNQQQRQDAVRAALALFAEWTTLQPFKLDQWLIDAGGEQFDTVTSFCRDAKRGGLPARAIVGRAGRNYNPATKTQFGRVRARVYQCFSRDCGKWACFDADFYKEAAQTSWITPVGEPGSATIHAGSCRDYASQMCREVLESKGVLQTRSGFDGGFAYKWATLPGKHDFLDCHAMAFAAAGYEGVLLADASTQSAAPHGNHRNKRKVYNG